MFRIHVVICLIAVSLAEEHILDVRPDCKIELKFSYSNHSNQLVFCKPLCSSVLEDVEKAIKSQQESGPARLLYLSKEVNKLVEINIKEGRFLECKLRNDSTRVGIDPDTASSTHRRVVRQVGGGCGVGYEFFENIQWCVKISNISTSWNQSVESCAAAGDRLAIVDTAEKQEAISAIMKKRFIKDLWIGLSDLQQEGVFRWVDGTVLSNHSRIGFHRSQPDSGVDLRRDNDENCVHFSSSWKYKWNDVTCRAHFQYLCEKKTFSITRPSVFPGVSICPVGWSGISTSDRCYRVGKQKFNFDNSVAYCAAKGGHLASIPHSLAMQFIKELLATKNIPKVWIGLDNRHENGIFKWIDGSPRSYESWAPNSPGKYVGQEKCIFADNAFEYKWNDDSCFQIMRPLCARESEILSLYIQKCPSGSYVLKNFTDFSDSENECPSPGTEYVTYSQYNHDEGIAVLMTIIISVTIILFILLVNCICCCCLRCRKMRKGPIQHIQPGATATSSNREFKNDGKKIDKKSRISEFFYLQNKRNGEIEMASHSFPPTLPPPVPPIICADTHDATNDYEGPLYEGSYEYGKFGTYVNPRH